MVIRLIVFTIVSSFYGVLSAYASPACDLNTELDNTNSHKWSGYFSRDSRIYPFDVYSAWAPKSASKSEMCLRYEIRNTGDEPIEKLRWKDLGINFVDISEYDFFKWRRDRTSRKDEAEISRSSILSFERSEQRVEAFFTQEDNTVRQAAWDDVFENKTIEFTSAYGDSYPMLASLDLASRNISAFQATESMDVLKITGIDPIRLSDEVVTNGIEIRSESAIHADKDIVIINYIAVKGNPDKDIRIMDVTVPSVFLYASKFSFERDRGVYAALAGQVSSGEKLVRYKSDLDGKTVSIESQIYFGNAINEGDLIYKSQFPITINTDKGRMCITLTTFSSLPYFAGESFCDGTN